jgi:hypothetical protein
MADMDIKERKEILEMYKDFRVTDVRDGMDWCGYHHYGTVHHSIRPLWRTKAIGFARTARYVPFEGPVPKNLSKLRRKLFYEKDDRHNFDGSNADVGYVVVGLRWRRYCYRT